MVENRCAGFPPYAFPSKDIARQVLVLGQLAQVLRERTLVDVDCWSVVEGQPIPPRAIAAEIERRLVARPKGSAAAPAVEEVPCTV